MYRPEYYLFISLVLGFITWVGVVIYMYWTEYESNDGDSNGLRAILPAIAAFCFWPFILPLGIIALLGWGLSICIKNAVKNFKEGWNGNCVRAAREYLEEL